MTVRTWFRLLRANQFNHDLNAYTSLPTIYFRSETGVRGPLTGPVHLDNWREFDAFIEQAITHQYSWTAIEELYDPAYMRRMLWKMLEGLTK